MYAAAATWAHRHRVVLLLVLLFAASWLSVSSILASDRVAVAWPASGLIAGLMLSAPDARRIRSVAAAAALLLGVLVLHDYPLGVAAAVTAISLGSAGASYWRLRRGLGDRRPGLLDQGDVSRLVAAVTTGAGLAAAGVALMTYVADRGDPLLAAVSAFGAHAASLLILLPLFMETPTFPALAPRRERLVQSVLTVGVTAALFAFSDLPPLVFAVMPMFAWLAFRGTLRGASLLLVSVGVVATGFTALHLGPVWGLQERYDLPPQLAAGFLQLFLVDCALVLLPISVIVTQHRVAAAQVAQDASEREATHRALVAALEHERSAVDRLRELERVKGDFVATVSHELRTPITSMVGYLELLEDGAAGELTCAQRDLVDRIQRNGRRLHLLVEDLLMLSEIEARRMTITPVPTDLCTIVRRAYDAAQPLLEGRRLDVSLHLPDEPVPHHGDPDQLERALLNLVSNAVKFTRDGGSVEVRLTVSGPLAEVVVTDTGIGIPAHEQEHVFTRFWRSSVAYDEAIQGTGLGLVIAQAIVSHHEGRLALVSEEGAGTTVTATLPCVPGAAARAGLSVAG